MCGQQPRRSRPAFCCGRHDLTSLRTVFSPSCNPARPHKAKRSSWTTSWRSHRALSRLSVSKLGNYQEGAAASIERLPTMRLATYQRSNLPWLILVRHFIVEMPECQCGTPRRRKLRVDSRIIVWVSMDLLDHTLTSLPFDTEQRLQLEILSARTKKALLCQPCAL